MRFTPSKAVSKLLLSLCRPPDVRSIKQHIACVHRVHRRHA